MIFRVMCINTTRSFTFPDHVLLYLSCPDMMSTLWLTFPPWWTMSYKSVARSSCSMWATLRGPSWGSLGSPATRPWPLASSSSLPWLLWPQWSTSKEHSGLWPTSKMSWTYVVTVYSVVLGVAQCNSYDITPWHGWLISQHAVCVVD